MTYVEPEILDDEGAVTEAILTAIADQIPGWEPSEGHVETAVAEAMGTITATIAALLKDTERDTYSGFAQNILGIARQAAQPSSATARWTMADDTGYTVPDGSQLVVRAPDGTAFAFATIGDLQIPAASTFGDIPVESVETGPDANGITGPAVEFDQVTGALSVTLTTVSSGGADVEPIAEFADRAADRARRLRAIPITPGDFAAIATDHPSAARAMPVNLLDAAGNAGAGLTNQPGHITVFPVDEAGEAVSAPNRAEILALLDGDERPLNIVVHVSTPTYTTVNVVIQVRLDPGATSAVMTPIVQAAVAAALYPGTWALDPDAPGRWRAPVITADRTITSFDMAHVADSVPGIAGVVTCTVNGSASVSLTGYAPLPRAGTVTVTVAT